MSAETIQPGDLVHDRDDSAPDDAVVVTPQSKTAAEWTLGYSEKTLAEDNPDYPADCHAITVVYVDDLIEYGPPFDPKARTPLSMGTLNESPVRYYTFPAPRLKVIESPAAGLTDTASPTEGEEHGETTASAATTDATESDPAASTQSSVDSDNKSDATDSIPATEQTIDAGEDNENVGDGVEDDSERQESEPSSKLQQLKATLEDNDLSVTVEGSETLTVERLGQIYYIRSDGSVEGDGALRSRLETIIQNAT